MAPNPRKILKGNLKIFIQNQNSHHNLSNFRILCGGTFLWLYFKCISIQAPPYRVVGIQQLYCFSIVKEVLDLPPCATAILLGVVFAQMMYHHSVNQQMSLKLKRCAFLLFLNLWWDLMLAKIQKPGYQQSDWKKMYPGNQKREQKGPKRIRKD